MTAPHATVTHAIRGRARIRVHERKGHAGWFEETARALAKHRQVREVRVNAGTGSLLIRHVGELAELLDWARDEALFDPREEASNERAQEKTPFEGPPTADAAWRAVERLDRRMRRGGHSRLDLRSYAFYGLATAGLFQLARGHLFPPASSLLQAALELARSAHRDIHESDVAPPRSSDEPAVPTREN